MTNEQKAAYVIAQAMCADAEIRAMFVANMASHNLGQEPPWKYQDFMDIPNKYGIHHNAVLELFHGR